MRVSPGRHFNRLTCFLASLALVLNLAGPYLFAVHLGSCHDFATNGEVTSETPHAGKSKAGDQLSDSSQDEPGGHHDGHTCTLCQTYSHLQLCPAERVSAPLSHQQTIHLFAPSLSITIQEQSWSSASPRAPPQFA